MVAERTPAQGNAQSSLLTLCRAVVRDMMVNYEWGLVSEEELVKRVLVLAGETTTRSRLGTLALQEYTLILYQACVQRSDQAQNEQAFAELYRFIYATALRKWPDMAEDLSQQALMLVYEQVERCHKPGAFLKFALFKLRQAETQWIRYLEKIRAEEQKDEVQQSHAEVQPASLYQQITRREQLLILLQAISRIPDRRKQEVIILKFFTEMSDEEIAERMHISANYVRVLRNRGIEQLRKDMNLKGYFEESDS